MILDMERTGTVVFLNPEMLWILPVMLFVVLLARWIKRDSGQQGYQLNPAQKPLSVIHPLSSLLPKQTIFTRHRLVRAAVAWLIFSVLVLALANPVSMGARLPQVPASQDIVLIVDTSVGMLIKDYQAEGRSIDRMNMLKAALQRYAMDFAGYRLSVIVFGDSAHTLVPFTADSELIRHMLFRIETGMAGRFSEVGEAIVYAVKEISEHSKRHPVMILFTAMNQSVGDVSIDSAARLAAQHKLPLYTVAIGSANGMSPQSQEALSSGLIYGPVNLPALRHIAELTGASAYHAGDIAGLKNAINDITQREKSSETSPVRYYQKPLYPIALVCVIIVLAAIQWFPILLGRHY